MELPSQAKLDDLNIAWVVIETQVRECYGRVVYTHKAHEKNSDLCLDSLKKTKFLQMLLSALVTGGSLGIFFSDGSTILTVITASIATLQFFLNAYIKEYSLSESAERHSVTAIKLWNVREDYLSLLTDIISKQTSLEEVREKREKLQKDLVTIYEKAPRTTLKAYKQAQKALKVNEELTFTDDEIDLFLPDILKKKHRQS